MNSAQSKIVKIISGIAGLAGSGILIGAAPLIDAAAPGWGVKVIAYITLVSFGATLLLQIIGSSPPAGTQWLVAPKVSSGDVAHVAPETAPAVALTSPSLAAEPATPSGH
jgi:hypothetical protein